MAADSRQQDDVRTQTMRRTVKTTIPEIDSTKIGRPLRMCVFILHCERSIYGCFGLSLSWLWTESKKRERREFVGGLIHSVAEKLQVFRGNSSALVIVDQPSTTVYH